MGVHYTVQAGECVSSIAEKHGFFWKTIWNDGNNTALRNKRQDPNVLSEGDDLFIPDLTPGNVSGATEARHSFKLKGVPAKLKMRLMLNKQPRKNVSYTLFVDGQILSGETDSDGCLEQPIPPGATSGKLVITTHGVREERILQLGDLDPADSNTGVKDRLTNLGYKCGPSDDPASAEFSSALGKFQTDQKLSVTGQLDDATKQKLKQIHGF